MGIERRDPEMMRQFACENARRVAEGFLPGIDPDLRVEVDDVIVTPKDKEEEKYRTVTLRFTHAKRPEINWTMDASLDEDYLKNDFEKVVRRIYEEYVKPN